MRVFLLFFMLVFSTLTVQGQENGRNADLKFYAEASDTEVLAGEQLTVTFHLENGQGGRFTPPDWDAAGFTVLGSNQSSSISIINGETTSSLTYNYVVIPREPGKLEIPSAAILIGKKEYHTETLPIKVSPNPDGTVQKPRAANPRNSRAVPQKEEKLKKPIKTTRI
ncbi:MAG: BatD family protein [Bacteroidota bacterium]